MRTNGLLQQISRAQAAAAAAAAKAAFVAVQQQHLGSGGLGQAYSPDIPLFRDANTLLAAAGVSHHMDPIGTALAGAVNTVDSSNEGNLHSISSGSVSSAEGASPLMAMNLSTNTKIQRDNLTLSDAAENIHGRTHTKDGNIDLSLPITSTYLKRMKALGLSGGYENLYGQHGALFNVST